MSKKIYQKKGFTFVEMLLVVIIMLVLATMVLPNFTGRGEQGAARGRSNGH